MKYMVVRHYSDRNNGCWPCGKAEIRKFGVGKKFSGKKKGAVGISHSNTVNSINSRIYKYSKCVHNTGD